MDLTNSNWSDDPSSDDSPRPWTLPLPDTQLPTRVVVVRNTSAVANHSVVAAAADAVDDDKVEDDDEKPAGISLRDIPTALSATGVAPTEAMEVEQQEPKDEQVVSNDANNETTRNDKVKGDDDVGEKKKSSVQSRKRRRLEQMWSRRLALGTFRDGRQIYANRLHPNESSSRISDDGDGGDAKRQHVHISELVLPETTTCVCTTFVRGDPEWYKTFLDNEYVEHFIVVAHDGRPDGRFVGDAELVPMFPHLETDLLHHQQQRTEHSEGSIDENGRDDDDVVDHEFRQRRTGWRWLLAKPRSGGILHAKLLLFRNNRAGGGLRVVVSGNNLHQGQWETDRDCLWVQDFFECPPLESPSRATMISSPSGGALGSFLSDLTQCRDGEQQQSVNTVLDALFHNINMTTATARLVFSFPRTTAGALQGGWIQLASAVRSVLQEMGIQSENSQYEHGATSTKADVTLYAMAGSFGNLWPEFLLQMKQAIQGKVPAWTPKHKPSWNDVDGLQCLWPSCETALSSYHLQAIVGSMRAMPLAHWRSIPKDARRRIFCDALPNTNSFPLFLEDDGAPRHALSHAKVLLLEAKQSQNDNISVIYVGSHNFSQAAWGLKGAAPKNIEVGVVLASTSWDEQQSWRSRLPYRLPADPSFLLSVTYVPASAHNDIRRVFELTGGDEVAFAMLRHALKKRWDQERDGGQVKLAIEID